MAMINFSPRFRGDAERAGPVPARQMKLAEALMQNSARSAPNAMYSTGEGVAHVADRALSGFLAGQARRDETAAQKEEGRIIAGLAPLLVGNGNPGASGGASADMPAPGAEPASGGGFPASLIDTESGGNWNALNNEVGAGGARGHGGRLQFGNARLEDAANAGVIPAGMTAQQFAQQPPEIQQAVENWHFSDIDREIQSRGLDQYIGQNIGGAPATLDGMRAVAHLGGIRGLERFVTSGGQYNPSDSFGTSLSDYFSRHAGNTASMADTPAQGASQASMANNAVYRGELDGVPPDQLQRNPVDRGELAGVDPQSMLLPANPQGIAQALAQLHPENQQQASYASMPADQARRMGGMLLGPQATRQEAGISPRVPGAGRDFQNVQQTGDVAAMGGAPGAFGLTGPGVQAGPMGVTPRTPFEGPSSAVEMGMAPMQAPQQRQPAPAPAPAPAPQATPAPQPGAMQRDMPAQGGMAAQGQVQPAFMQAVNDPSIDPDAYGDGQRMPRQIGNILAARSFIEQGRPVPERLQGMIEQDMQRGSPQAIGAALTGGGSQAPRQVTQAAGGGMTPQQGMPPAGGSPMAAQGAPQGMSDPDAILQEALMNPRTRDVAIQVLQQRQAEQQRMAEEQQRRAQLGRAGINPDYAGIDPLISAAAQDRYRADPTSMREYQLAQQQGYEGSFLDYQTAMAEAKRPQTNVDARNMGSIPPGMQLVTDPEDGTVRMEEIPGGPAERERLAEERSRERQQNLTARQLNPTIDDITTARDLASAETLGFIPRTGMFSGVLRMIPLAGQSSVDLERTVEGIKAGTSLENLNQMRQASPTGGALGNVSDKQSALLSDAFGSLDTNLSQPVFLYNLARVENTLNDIVHGPDGGPPRHDIADMRQRLRDQMGVDSSALPGSVDVWGDSAPSAPQGEAPPAPEGVDPEIWQFMTPEERALWR